MKIGYARVSTDEQDTALQLDTLHAAGCEKIYEETISSRSKSRPQLDRLLDNIRDGDVVVVYRLDRLGRSLKDLISLLEIFRERHVQFISLTESIDTTSAMGNLVFNLIASIAEFERDLISERTKAGLAAARARGRNGGRKPALSQKQIKLIKSMLQDQSVTKTDVAKHFKVSRPTLNKALADADK